MLMQQGVPGVRLNQYVKYYHLDAGEQVEMNQKQGAEEIARYCAQLLDMAEHNSWLPEDVLTERRSKLEELREEIGQLGEKAQCW